MLLLLFLTFLVQSISFQPRYSRNAALYTAKMVTTDVIPPQEKSDVRKMIDEAAVTLMKRFWEIDLQTQRRMDMILKLYEVAFNLTYFYPIYILFIKRY
jgi:hypothetical protein